MPVDIRGKSYNTVAERIAKFREEHPDWPVQTELVSADDERVVMVARIFDPGITGDFAVATGYAEEVRGSSNINKTSALENCETSAVGRALAFFGLAGTEIASADEVANAISQQNEKKLYEEFAKVTAKNWEHHESLIAIREFLAEENWSAAREAWNEVPHDDQRIIWRATTKGGWFTTKEREQMKTWPNEVAA